MSEGLLSFRRTNSKTSSSSFPSPYSPPPPLLPLAPHGCPSTHREDSTPSFSSSSSGGDNNNDIVPSPSFPAIPPPFGPPLAAVDFPMQFNFGSAYGSSVTVLFNDD